MRPHVLLSRVRRRFSSQVAPSDPRLECREPGKLDFVHHSMSTSPPKEGGSVVIKAIHLLSDNCIAFQSFRNLDRACLFAPRQDMSQTRFIWENLCAGAYLHCSARPGNEGPVISHSKLPDLTNCPVYRRFASLSS